MTGHAMLSLLCLLTAIPSGMLLTEQQLATVTEYIKDEISSGYLNFEHAYAVTFSSDDCKQLSKEDVKNALRQEDIDALRRTVTDFGIYEGPRMVSASFSRYEPTMHAEYRLLHGDPGRVSPVENLMNKAPKGGCVVFFTLYSPCLSRCVNTEDYFNIVKELSVFDKVNVDRKAFVFRNIYADDKKRTPDEIWKGWRELDQEMPLFRCKNKDCHRCFITPAGKKQSLPVQKCIE